MNNIIFIGGSRKITHLKEFATKRIDNIVTHKFDVIVGDANGMDKAVQKYLHSAGHQNVTVFYSGKQPRNNLGNWLAKHIAPPKGAKGYNIHAAKDREMALGANYGLMLWDGESLGTLLNIYRLLRVGKKSRLLQFKNESETVFGNMREWKSFLDQCNVKIVEGIAKRMREDTVETTDGVWQDSLFASQERMVGGEMRIAMR